MKKYLKILGLFLWAVMVVYYLAIFMEHTRIRKNVLYDDLERLERFESDSIAIEYTVTITQREPMRRYSSTGDLILTTFKSPYPIDLSLKVYSKDNKKHSVLLVTDPNASLRFNMPDSPIYESFKIGKRPDEKNFIVSGEIDNLKYENPNFRYVSLKTFATPIKIFIRIDGIEEYYYITPDEIILNDFTEELYLSYEKEIDKLIKIYNIPIRVQ